MPISGCDYPLASPDFVLIGPPVSRSSFRKQCSDCLAGKHHYDVICHIASHSVNIMINIYNVVKTYFAVFTAHSIKPKESAQGGRWRRGRGARDFRRCRPAGTRKSLHHVWEIGSRADVADGFREPGYGNREVGGREAGRVKGRKAVLQWLIQRPPSSGQHLVSRGDGSAIDETCPAEGGRYIRLGATAG